MTNALAHLRAYPYGKLDPADAEAVESLIADYLDGLLEPSIAEQVAAAIEADADVSAAVDEVREGKAWVEQEFAPESRRLMQQSASPGTIDLIRSLANDDESTSEDDTVVVPFEKSPAKSEASWQPWLMAASIAGMLLAGGGTYHLMQTRLDKATSQQLALSEEIGRLTAERDANASRVAALDDDLTDLRDQVAGIEELRASTAAELNEANQTIATLENRQGGLERQVTALRDELASTVERGERLEQQRTALASDVDRLQAALTNAGNEREQAEATLAANRNDLVKLGDELEELQAALAESNEAREIALAELDESEATITALRGEQVDAEQRLAVLDAKLNEADDTVKKFEQERSASTSQINRLQTALAEASSERDDATRALAAANKARAETALQLADNQETLEALEEERTDLERRLVLAALQAETIASTVQQRDRHLASLEEELAIVQAAENDARNQIAQLAIERRDLDAELVSLRANQRWLPQVAKYHNFYAKLPERRWAEESPQDQNELNNLLADLGNALSLDGPIPLPNQLSGLNFVGGRPLPVNGMPVVQLAYVDPNGQLFAFCFMPNRSGQTKPRRPQRFGDLTTVDWSDTKFQYVVVGYGPVQALSDIAEQLQRSYRLDA